MLQLKTEQEVVIKALHQVEIRKLIVRPSLPIIRVITNQHGITAIVETINQHVLPNHIQHQQGQIQKAIVSLQKLHVPIVLQAGLETAEVILLPANLEVADHILHHQGHHHLHLPAQVVEVVPGHQAVAPDQVEEEDKIS